MIKKFNNFLNQKNFLSYLIILLFLSIGIIFEPLILGTWESLNYYYSDRKIVPKKDLGSSFLPFIARKVESFLVSISS